MCESVGVFVAYNDSILSSGGSLTFSHCTLKGNNFSLNFKCSHGVLYSPDNCRALCVSCGSLYAETKWVNADNRKKILPSASHCDCYISLSVTVRVADTNRYRSMLSGIIAVSTSSVRFYHHILYGAIASELCLAPVSESQCESQFSQHVSFNFTETGDTG